MAVISGAALMIALFLPKTIMPPERLPYFGAAFTAILAAAAGAEAKQIQAEKTKDSDRE